MSSHYKVVLIIFFALAIFQAQSNPFDSLRIDKIKGKKFIIHRVDPKETLYSISRRYHSSIDEIYAHNPQIESRLKMYDELKIPYDKKKTIKPAPTVIVQSTVDAKYSIVKKGQTLYALSKQTGISVESLKEINQLNSNAISIGDTIYWNSPTKAVTTPTVDKPVVQQTISKEVMTFHEVLAGETLFFISKKYNVTVDELVTLNNLDSYVLEVGKKLIISKENKAITNPESTTDTTKAPPEKEATVTEADKEELLREKRSRDTVFVKTDNHAIRTKIDEQDGETTVVEEGFALEINDTDHTTKLLALHKTAPLGSLVSITNQMNDKTIQVRVVGELLDSPLNKNVVVRLSNSAFKTLGALDYKIPVTSKYVQ